MMSLRTFVAGICISLVLVLVGIHYTQAQLVLAQRFSAIEATHKQASQQYASTIIRAKRYLLRSYLSEINSQGKLGALFLDRKSGSVGQALTTKLREIKTSAQLDLLSIHPLREAPAGFDRKYFAAATGGETTFTTELLDGQPHFIAYFPVKVFQSPVAVGIAGFRLDTIAKEVEVATGASVGFGPIGTSPLDGMAILDESGFPLSEVKISKSAVGAIAKQANSGFFIVGLLGLLVALGLMYSVLYFGFARDFSKVTKELDELALNVDRGNVSQLPIHKFSVRELSNLSSKLSGLSGNILNFQHRISRKSRTEATGEQAEQLAHDLKGPVTALAMAVESQALDISPDASKHLIQLIDRIRAVASGLERYRNSVNSLESNPKLAEEIRPEDVRDLVNAIVIEKSFQYQDRANIRLRVIDSSRGTPLFSHINRATFLRSLSNLIDNAVEACQMEGEVDLQVTGTEDSVLVTVSDSGVGMSEEQLKSIGTRGYTSGKRGGSGLGSWFALSAVTSWGGTLTFESEPANGTKVLIELPRSACPAWIADKVIVPAQGIVIICDDDQWVHDAWESRLIKALGPDITGQIRHCYTSEDLLNVMVPVKLKQSPFVVLCDFDLGGQWNGLELIDQLGLNKNSYLVTSHENNDALRLKCQEAGVKLLSKGRLSDVSITIIPPKTRKHVGGGEE